MTVAAKPVPCYALLSPRMGGYVKPDKRMAAPRGDPARSDLPDPFPITDRS